MKSRTRARGLALQALYEIDIANHSIKEVMETRLNSLDLEQRHLTFARDIVEGVFPLRQALDDYIAEHAPEWPIDQISTIDRNLLRIAMWEFAINQETPIKVAINEAVELAKTYGSDSAPRFVNGVLGSLAERQNEIHLAMVGKLEVEESNLGEKQ
jgi:N utilization substance protein B